MANPFIPVISLLQDFFAAFFRSACRTFAPLCRKGPLATILNRRSGSGKALLIPRNSSLA